MKLVRFFEDIEYRAVVSRQGNIFTPFRSLVAPGAIAVEPIGHAKRTARNNDEVFVVKNVCETSDAIT